jgi:hypothetical protein
MAFLIPKLYETQVRNRAKQAHYQRSNTSAKYYTPPTDAEIDEIIMQGGYGRRHRRTRVGSRRGKRQRGYGAANTLDVDLNADGAESAAKHGKVSFDTQALVGVPTPVVTASLTSVPELDYNDQIKLQTQIQKTQGWILNPSTTIQKDGNIEFSYPGTDCYVKMDDTRIWVQVKITKPDGKAIEEWKTGTAGAADAIVDDSATASLIQYPSGTMWKSIQLDVAGNRLTKPHVWYPYTAFMDTKLSFDENYKKTRLSTCGWKEKNKDTSYIYGAANEATTGDTEFANVIARNTATAKSNIAEFLGPVHVNLCQQSMLLPPGVQFRFTFTPATDAFVLMQCGITKATGSSSAGDATLNVPSGAEPAIKCKLEIIKAKLHLKLVKVDPFWQKGQEAQMLQHPIEIPLRTVDVSTQNFPKGSQQAEILLVNGKWPRRIIIGCVRQLNTAGTLYQRNPFWFENLNITNIHFKKGSGTIPENPYTPNFSEQITGAAREYNDLLDMCFSSGSISTNSLTYEEWRQGMTFFAFDTTPDMEAAEDHISLPTRGSLTLCINTGTPLTDDYTIMAFMEFDESIKIKSTHEVLYIQ